jgi:hypothetical protein
MANLDIKAEAKQMNVKLWQIADALHLTDNTFSRKLRHEFSAEEKSKIRTIIAELKGAQ